MYPLVLGLHNVVRWVVIALGVWAVMLAWRGWLARRTWREQESRAARLFVTALDVQLLLGLLLYAFFSPLTRRGFSDPMAAMREAPVRYFLVEHTVVMLTAIVLAHVGWSRVKRAGSDSQRFQQAALWLGVALAAVVGFVPWWRPLFPSF